MDRFHRTESCPRVVAAIVLVGLTTCPALGVFIAMRS